MGLSSLKKYIFVSGFLVLFILTLTISLLAGQSATKSFTLDIHSNVVSTAIKSIEVTKIDGYDRVQISGLSNFSLTGEPLLPIKTVRYLLPYGKDINDVQVSWSNRKEVIGSYYVQPAQQPIPLSFKGVVRPTAPDAVIYNSTDPFPGKQYEIVSVQNLRGFRIAIINLFPVEYIPATGQIAYYENMTLNLALESTNEALPYDLYRGLACDRQLVSASVDNPDELSSYPVSEIASLAAVDYLIIASSDFVDFPLDNSLADLAAHKLSKFGLTTAILKTSDIYANATFNGNDNQDEIRNCITYYYTNYGTEYVLLVGDSDGNFTDTTDSSERQRWNHPYRLPHRGLFASEGLYSDNNIPADLYYACLGGTFDFDADGIYGETTDGAGGGDVDLEAEVFVGRAPVDSTTELANFVKKTIAYDNSTAAYLNKVVMAAEQLDSWPTWGGDYMDEVMNGTSANGYTTKGMAGSGFFSFDTLYDRNSSWLTADLVTKLNAGIHVLNHLGHATNTLLGKTFSNTDADGLTNTDYFIGYTQGCYSGAFDNRTTTAGSFETEDCILEHFTTEANGAVAFIGNSRYGWYSLGSTDGPSQRYHREFWDAVISEGKTSLAKALQDSKQDSSGLVIADGAYRWIYFGLNLLGDPHTPIHGDFSAPTDFSATNVFVENKSWVSIRWLNSNDSALQQTMIRYRTDGVYPTSSTDGTLLVERSATPGTADIVNHTSVENGKTYYYVGFGYDGSSYEGSDAVSNRASVTVIGGSGAASSGRSDCFIATVCYGSKDSSEVNKLRSFRDRILVNTFAGKQLISAYYLIGPKLARWIEDKEAFKIIIRKCLDPIAGCAGRLIGGD